MQGERLPPSLQIPGHPIIYRSKIGLACMSSHAWKDELLAYLPGLSKCMPLSQLLALGEGKSLDPRMERTRLTRELEDESFLVTQVRLPSKSTGGIVSYDFANDAPVVMAGVCSCPGNIAPALNITSGSPQSLGIGSTIANIRWSATDPDSDLLSETFSYTRDNGSTLPGLPAGLSKSCTTGTGTLTCVVSGTAPGTAGVYRIRLDVADGFNNVFQTATLTATEPRPPGGITVSAISGDTSEDGTSATFTMVLDNTPSQNVTVDVSSSDSSEGIASPASLTFTPANWADPQQVTVTGQDDALQDGTVAYTIITDPSVSSDGLYSGINAADVSVSNLDNEVVNTVDRPVGGVPIFSGCDGGQLVRAFNVTDDFAIGTLNVGFSAGISSRGQLSVTLQSPLGTFRELMSADAGDNNADYDILLSAQAGAPLNSGAPDDLAEPFYDRMVEQALLNDFAGERSAGTWTMSICDTVTDVDDGVFYGAVLDLMPANQDPDYCNLNVVPEDVESGAATLEACETLSIGPYSAIGEADVTLQAGLEIMLENGFSVGQGATLKAQVCGQSLCSTSETPMPLGCHSCVDQICAIDSACCEDAFSAQCLEKVDSVCGLSCE